MKEVREMQACTEGRPSTQASADSGFPLPGAPVLCPQLREQPNPKLFFYLLEQKWSYISYRNFLLGAKDDPRKRISLASVAWVAGRGVIGGWPWQSLWTAY